MYFIPQSTRTTMATATTETTLSYGVHGQGPCFADLRDYTLHYTVSVPHSLPNGHRFWSPFLEFVKTLSNPTITGFLGGGRWMVGGFLPFRLFLRSGSRDLAFLRHTFTWPITGNNKTDRQRGRLTVVSIRLFTNHKLRNSNKYLNTRPHK